MRIGEGKRRITRDRPVEVLDRARERLQGVLDEQMLTLQKKLVGVDVPRRLPPHPCLLVWREFRFERRRDVKRDIGLD